jgi:phenylalanyl-tRNA synthetase beta chain
VELRGRVSALSELLRVGLTLVPGGEEPYLAAGLQWQVADTGGQVIGVAGRLSRGTTEALDLDRPAAVVEIDLGRLDLTPRPVRYAAFSRFPAVKRDLSLLVPRGVTYAQLADVVRAGGGEHLDSLELFDIYEGKGVPEGHAAYGIRLQFRSATGSLEGKAVDRAVARITAALCERLEVQPRT